MNKMTEPITELNVDLNAIVPCEIKPCDEPAVVKVIAKRDNCGAHNSLMCEKHFAMIIEIFITKMRFHQVICGGCRSVIVTPGETFDSAISVKSCNDPDINR